MMNTTKGDYIMTITNEEIKVTETHTITYKNKNLVLTINKLKELNTSGSEQILIVAPNGMSCCVTGINRSYTFGAGKRTITFSSEELDSILIGFIRKYRYV
tara:strand:+ start:225 stop:527 length:303 start_codon:yes stop_codon:yes gene_type:complete